MTLPDLDPIEESCLLVAYWRAREAARPDALVRDPVAARLLERHLGPDLRDRYSRSRLFHTAVDVHAVATRLVDERLLAWLDGGGDCRQVVNVGAGLDARPHRLRMPAGVRFFHVDSAAVNAFARELLAEADALDAPADIARIDGRIEATAAVAAALAARGLDLAAPAFWLFEGLIEFLGPRRTAPVLADLAARAAPGSEMAVQVIDAAFVDLAHQVGDPEFPWRRLPALADVVAAFAGWEVAVTSPAEIDRRFGRGVGRLSHLVSARRA
jgi:methyltransferase (TIGR00027 family)